MTVTIPPVPSEPDQEPSAHDSPKAYAETWWRYHREVYKWAWASLAKIGDEIANGDHYPALISEYSSYTWKIEYHGAMAQHFVNVHSFFEDPNRDSDGWAVYSISMGRELFDNRPHNSSNEIRNWSENIKRQATLAFIQQCLPLLDKSYLLGER